jgi:hypothetical protein
MEAYCPTADFENYKSFDVNFTYLGTVEIL